MVGYRLQAPLKESNADFLKDEGDKQRSPGLHVVLHPPDFVVVVMHIIDWLARVLVYFSQIACWAAETVLISAELNCRNNMNKYELQKILFSWFFFLFKC